nr:MAG TPA: Scaffold protein [Microviridae sp.]
MIFRKQYEREKGERFVTDSGSPEYTVYVADEDGNPVPSGVRNLYDEIQSHREATELAVLLQRYMQGDETALNQLQGVYEDVTDYPRTFAELYQRVHDAEESFNSLPPDLRAIFEDSPVSFWQSMGTPEFNRRINEYQASQQKKKNNNNSNSQSGDLNSQVSGNGGVVNESKSE